MEENLIAPCGVNCSVCVSYLAMKVDLNKKGFSRKYCPGCLPRGQNCTFMAHHCELLGKGLVRFCFECSKFPCRRLKDLDKRYSSKYNMGLIEGLIYIKEQGLEKFLEKEAEKWCCPACGGVISCHTGVCMYCGIDRIRRKNKKT